MSNASFLAPAENAVYTIETSVKKANQRTVNLFVIGILAKSNLEYVAAAASLGVTPDKLAHLNWISFFLGKLVPVTLGNIVGGGLFVGLAYWYVFIKSGKLQTSTVKHITSSEQIEKV